MILGGNVAGQCAPSSKTLRCSVAIIPLLAVGMLFLPTHAAAISSRTLIAPTGEASSNYFGSSVALAGDVNGDGYPHVIVGAPYNLAKPKNIEVRFTSKALSSSLAL